MLPSTDNQPPADTLAEGAESNTESTTEASDQKLAEQVAAGQQPDGNASLAEVAFMALYDRHSQALAAYIARVAHPSAVEDISQDVWRRTWEKLPARKSDSPFRPWLFTVAKNCITDSWRDATRRRAVTLDDTGELTHGDQADVDEGLIDAEVKAALARCIEKLEGRPRAIVTLRWQGSSYEQICQQEQIDHNQAYKAYHHATRQLSDCVKRSNV